MTSYSSKVIFHYCTFSHKDYTVGHENDNNFNKTERWPFNAWKPAACTRYFSISCSKVKGDCLFDGALTIGFLLLGIANYWSFSKRKAAVISSDLGFLTVVVAVVRPWFINVEHAVEQFHCSKSEAYISLIFIWRKSYILRVTVGFHAIGERGKEN